MLDTLSDTREDKTYNAVYLENEYVKICVLPEIGGRVFAALDKTNNYDFLYRQHVIKPALIGMLGAWVSGGIEWCIPHHHRATTFMPVDYTLQDNPDGSKTVWVGEIELRHRTKWLVGLTLYPGKSYMEATVKIVNRTPFVNSLLYWANVSVHANEQYQVIFPPGTEYAAYHGKNQFSGGPISHEVYAGTDYTEGVDVSWWKNHPSPISFFAWNYKDDFLAGYDHGRQAGTAYVANHHVAPGKKLWEWGPGPRGRIWDKILTETDGPYIEIMAGAYSDNQPDYSWIQPYEAKIIKQYWYPVRQIGGPKNANVNGAVNLELTQDSAVRIAFNTTSRRDGAQVLLTAADKVIFKQKITIDPGRPFDRRVPLPAGVAEKDLRVSLLSSANQELIAYKPLEKPGEPMPAPVKSPPAPKDIETVEELYLTGLRLDQFHHATLEPYPYYEEALKRDPNNSLVNTELGILYCKRGMFEDAQDHLTRAIDRLTKNYTSSQDGRPLYYLGVVLKFQGEYDAAYDALYKATWSHAFHSAAYYQLAEIDCIRGNFQTAFEHIDRSIAANAWNTQALNLKSAVLRHLGRTKQAIEVASQTLTFDPLDFRAGYELYLAQSADGHTRQAKSTLNNLKVRMRGEVQSYLELAVDYANCGLWDDAIGVLTLLTDAGKKKSSTHPMVYYYLGYLSQKNGQTQQALSYYNKARSMSPDYCFPFRLESIDVLNSAGKANPSDPRAPYYLGNLLYDNQPSKAIEQWEKSRDLDDSFATVHRNLAFAYAQVNNDVPKAIAGLEKAVACDKNDPRLYYELDLLYEAGGAPPQKRLALLEENHKTVAQRDDALSRQIALCVQAAQYDRAIELLTNRHFHTWEGGGQIHDVYVDAHLLRGREKFNKGQHAEALKDYQAALEYPENLEVGRPAQDREFCRTYFLMGASYEALSQTEKARECFEKAALMDVGQSQFGYYKGLALRKVGRENDANKVFDDLIESAKPGPAVEFFAKFGEKQTHNSKLAQTHYLLGLAHLGKGDHAKAGAELEKALELNPNHLWAAVHLSDLN
jgi:tetratricopeptide (TPR) repeat protein